MRNIALHRATVDVGPEILEGVVVTARRGVAKLHRPGEGTVLEVGGMTSIEVLDRDRLYRIRFSGDVPAWVIRRDSGCKECGTHVETSALASYRD